MLVVLNVGIQFGSTYYPNTYSIRDANIDYFHNHVFYCLFLSGVFKGKFHFNLICCISYKYVHCGAIDHTNFPLTSSIWRRLAQSEIDGGKLNISYKFPGNHDFYMNHSRPKVNTAWNGHYGSLHRGTSWDLYCILRQ